MIISSDEVPSSLDVRSLLNDVQRSVEVSMGNDCDMRWVSMGAGLCKVSKRLEPATVSAI